MNKIRLIKIGLVIILIGLIFSFNKNSEIKFSGETMGTTYTIVYYDSGFSKFYNIQPEIDTLLEDINSIFSTYIQSSELSQLNRRKSKDLIKTSYSLYYLLDISKQLYRWSNGLWDPTIKPLIDLWGFSSEESTRSLPDNDDIRNVLKNIGYSNLEFYKGNKIRKVKDVTIDLSSIAKGYAVDKVSEYLKNKELSSFMVEIGGEVRVGNRKPNGNKWKIGINTPQANAPKDNAIKILELENISLATSGDYRQYFESDGKKYSHILNPKTGYPVDWDIVSVSVLGPSCTVTDGLATAIMVSGLEVTKKTFNWDGYKVYVFSPDNELIWISE